MGSPISSASEDNPKRSKKPKFLTNMSLTESYIRSDEISFDAVRTNVERSFGSSRDTQEGHHVVQDYLQLFGLHKMESYSINPSNFLKMFSSIINDLNNDALCLVANIITYNKISFVKTRPRMKKIIKNYLPKVLAESNNKDWPTLLQQLSQIFRSPSSFREKHLTLATPVTSHLLSTIHRTLEGLDDMPFHDLIALNRKLRGVTVVPQFPPVLFACKRDLLLERVKKRCKKILFTLEEGVDLPKPLSKALSVMRLSLKQKTRCVDILTSEFFPFSPEIVDLQNDILRALWSLPKVKYDELKALQPLVDPKAKVPRKTFRKALKKYLIECLFECDEIDVPDEVLGALAFINRRSRRRPLMCSKEMREEDTEVVLNVSSQLKQVAQYLLPDHSIDETSTSPYSEGLESDDNSESNDFELVGNNYCSNPGEREDQHIHRSCTNDEGEATGDSRPVPYSVSIATNGNYSHLSGAARGMIIKEPKLEQDADINASWPCPEESIHLHLQNSLQESESMREITVQEICDETSLISYRLIGHMLDKFLQIEGRDADAMTRYYLRGGSSLPADSQVTEDALYTSNEDTSTAILIQSVEEILPSLPKSCIGRVKKLLGMP